MNETAQLKIFLSTFAVYVPVLLVCLAAGILLLTKGRQAGSGAVWAGLGFGLSLALCFLMPLGHTLLQHWVFQDGQTTTRMWAYTAFSIFGSVMHAVVYALLLVAVFAGRRKENAPGLQL